MRNLSYDRNKFDSNLVYHYGGAIQIPVNSNPINWSDWQALGQDVHSVVADPLFIDPANGNYRLRTNSSALSLGFVQIPITQIGPYQDTRRASWPIVESPGARGF